MNIVTLQCYLLGSDLEDIITVWLDSAAEPIAVSISSLGHCILDNPFTNMWTTTVMVRYPDGGPIPDTAMYIQKLEREREARERGETKDNRSFLAKYVSIFLSKKFVYYRFCTMCYLIYFFFFLQWMYIVPALIFLLLSSATNPEAAAGGSAQRQ